jgi:hypothetical protein
MRKPPPSVSRSKEQASDRSVPGKVLSRNASEARQQFFSLLEDVVVRDPSQIVLIEHKDLPDAAALVSARFLFRVLRLLRSLRASGRGAATPFRLIGSATLVGSPTDPLAEVRQQQRALRDAKLDTL